MAEPFTILEKRIVHSTIWREDSDTRVVWITLLALANLEDGIIQASVPGLADVARVPLEKTRAALEKFMAPDTDSATASEDGRRIEVVKGGWRLLNFVSIKEAHQKARKNSYMAGYMRQHRQGQTPVVSAVGEPVPNREMVLAYVQKMRENGADYTDQEALDAFNYFCGNGWMMGRTPVADFRPAIESRISDVRRWTATDLQKGKGKHGTTHSEGISEQRINRNIGTCNEHTDFKKKYAGMERGPANPDVQRPATD